MRNIEKQMELGTVINYREGRGGGLQNGKTAGPKHFAAPLEILRQGKTFRVPLISMAKTSSSRVKTTGTSKL